MKRHFVLVATVAGVCTFLTLAGLTAAPKPATVSSKTTFENDVLPILKANCVQCHGPNTKMKELNLSTLEGVMHGSESGPVVIAGKPAESPLFKMVHEKVMPPGKKGLPEKDIATIQSWIEGGALSATQPAEAAGAPEVVTQHDVIPIMLLRCTVCHGPRRQEGGLDLRSKASMLKGGRSGPAIVLGKPEESLLIQKVRAGVMPPKAKMLEFGVKPITQPETDKVAKWIGTGAPEVPAEPDHAGSAADPLVSDKDRQFWAFQPPRAVKPPAVRNSARARNPVDSFILQKLEEKGMTLSPEADQITLVRRVFFDLTGLPPKPEEVQFFLADKSPDAYEKLVDRLLSSPRYGERWARHWLDVAGYADSDGGKLDADHPRPHAFRYRDYVIRSLNADKPYDRFLLEQIAGDELVDYEHAPVVTQEIMDNLVATGFLRMGPDSTSEREVDFVDDRLDVMGDEIDVLTSGVMGLTMKCARCHSHKYDPLPQRDYYRFMALLKGAYDENDWLIPFAKKTRPVAGRILPYIEPGLSPFELLENERKREFANRELDKELEALKSSLDQLADPLKKKLVQERLATIPKPLHEDLLTLIATPPDKRTETQKYLAAKFGKTIEIDLEDLKARDPQFRRSAEEIERKIKLAEFRRAPEPAITALWDRGDPTPTYILRRGNPASFGHPVEPGPPTVLMDPKTPFEIRPPWPGAHKTGRRLALARWLTRPDHPLTARVMVNRLWKQYFGTGIVKSLANFGHTGTPPSHPELLDWLSTEFVRQGWSMKAMHKLMVTSSTYRQSSTLTPATEKEDPANRLFSRMPLKRLEAEELNDTLIFVAGRMDETQFGPAQPVLVRKDGLVTPVETEKGWRRSIYVMHRRSEIPTILEDFDLPPMSPNCLERTDSTVAPQALHLMNNPMVNKLASFFAERLKKDAGTDSGKQVDRAYWLALSRPPTADEKKIALEALASFRQQAAKAPTGQGAATAEESAARSLTKFCHTLMNSAAFLYVD